MGRTKLLLALALASMLIALGAGTATAAEETALFPLGSGVHATSLTTGPDDNLWFTGGESSVIGKVTTDGVVTEFPLSLDHPASASIIVGPDGALWFTERGEDAIGRVTVGGEVTQYPLATSGSRPNSIAVGPDGNLWFTEGGASRIARMTSTGELTEFPMPSGRHPAGITAGPDGALWFTEYTANRIGRITIAGEISHFSLPGRDNRPNSIVAGDDGNLWFTQQRGHRVGRITPAGAVTQFPVPTVEGTGAITKAPNGDLWFAAGPEIGSISTNGRVSAPGCMITYCNAPAEALAFGPEGALWFASGAEHCAGYCGGGTEIALSLQPGKVGRFVPPPPGIGIGPRPKPVVGDKTDLGLICSLPGGCRGVLRLVVFFQGFPRYKNHPAVPRRTATVAEAPYEIGAEESRRTTLRITDKRALRSLRAGSTIYATAHASVEGASETSRSSIPLKLRRQPHRSATR